MMEPLAWVLHFANDAHVVMVRVTHTVAVLSAEVVSQRLDSHTGSHVQVASESGLR